MGLQEQIIDNKDKQLDAVTTVVKNSVENNLKEQHKSYNEAAVKNAMVCQDAMTDAVAFKKIGNSAVQEEDNFSKQDMTETEESSLMWGTQRCTDDTKASPNTSQSSLYTIQLWSRFTNFIKFRVSITLKVIVTWKYTMISDISSEYS